MAMPMGKYHRRQDFVYIEAITPTLRQLHIYIQAITPKLNKYLKIER
jgi:hypothetical protein